MTAPAPKKTARKKPVAPPAPVSEVIPNPTKSSPLMLTGSTYDFAKKLAQVVLPAAGALYFALSQIWGLPGSAKVVGTIAAINVFFGGLVTTSAKKYYNSDAQFDGAINIEQTEDSKQFSLELNDHPETLEGKKSVTFKVNK